MGSRGNGLFLMMPKAPANANSAPALAKVAGAILLLASLGLLAGCQGVSAVEAALGILSLPNPSVAFGNVAPGNTKTMTVTATNTGTAAINVSSVAISTQYFALTAPSLPLSIPAGQSTPISVTFTPNAAGTFNATMTIGSNASNAQATVALSGTGATGSSGTGTLSSNPATEAFGSVPDGTTQSQTVTLSNTGTATVNISQVAVSGTGFQISGITTPLALNAAQSTTFTVSFDPQTAGSATGNVTITSDASDSTMTMALSGTGVVPGALGSNPTSVPFGNVQVGGDPTASETITNTGTSSVTISAVTITGTGFTVSGITTPMTLAAGKSATFVVGFDPQTAASESGSVTITSTATNPTLTIPVSGTGVGEGALGSNPTSLSFGSVQVGSNQSLSETVTNTGGSSVTISAVAASGTGFTVSGITPPVTLTAGQGATFSVKFTPASAASASGNLTVTSNGSNPTLTIPLSGTGTAATAGVLAASPATIAIGSVVVGTNGTGTGSLTASGSSVIVSAVSSNNAAFTVSGLSLPVTIPAGQSAPFTVTYSPQATGAASATLTFTSNAQTTTTQEGVTGTGAAAPVHTVALSWNASVSTDVSGYNIYRAPYTSSCGTFAKINPSLNASTVYTDSSVTDGSAYCYAATTVDSSNAESGYSNIASDVQIPAP
jgi:uncharacterized protein DUF1573/centrosomal CEP192-like protein/HYDIN/CFA65/VesB family protein/ASPM-SPD-2-Hydin domain-containing protein